MYTLHNDDIVLLLLNSEMMEYITELLIDIYFKISCTVND